MTTTKNMALFAIFIIGLIFLFRIYCLSKKRKRRGSPLYLIINISIMILLSLFFYFFKMDFVSYFCLFFSDLFIFNVSSKGKEVIPYSDPSGRSSSSSWTEDSFEIRVLQEPFSETETEGTSENPKKRPKVAADKAGPSHQTTFSHNLSMESSLRNRIGRLEKEQSLFLNQNKKGDSWEEIKKRWIKLPLKGSMLN